MREDGKKIFNHFPFRPKCMPGSRDSGVTIVNPTEISVMYGYVTWRMTTVTSDMSGSEGVEKKNIERISGEVNEINFFFVISWN